MTTGRMELEQFARRFLLGRIIWHHVPRVGAIHGFPDGMVGIAIYRKPPFQVELFVCPKESSWFRKHRHPGIDTMEFPLSGDNTLLMDGPGGTYGPIYTREQTREWLKGGIISVPVWIGQEDFHEGGGFTPYSFLSIQRWPDGKEPTSVGLVWEEPA